MGINVGLSVGRLGFLAPGSASLPAEFGGSAPPTSGVFGLLLSPGGRALLAEQRCLGLTPFDFHGLVRADGPPVGQVVADAGKQRPVSVGIFT